LERYPTFAADLFAETGVNIELDRSGTLCLAFNESETAELAETLRRQKLRNVPVEYLSGDAVREIEPLVSASVQDALLYPSDWQVENRKVISALRTFARRSGVKIFENVAVTDLIIERSKVLGVKTAIGEMHADVTILATGAWTALIKFGDVSIPGSVKPIRGQMISIETGAREISRVIYSPRGYVVPRADGRVLIGATVEDVGFDKSVTAEGIDSLRSAGAEIIPRLGDLAIAERWAGLRPFAADGLPVLGDIPGYENIFVATAHFRNGILLAPKTAEIICDRILRNKTSKFLELYGVGRFSSVVNAKANS
jgi:glycine oxidase